MDITFDLGPASSSGGKANRLALGTALAIWAVGLTYIFVSQQGDARLSAALSALGGALVFIVSYLWKRKH